ncbi:MAG: proton-conducting transporter membrane subunit [Butyrivibrio sp.]|nr:proton-conducting transporter membrane subunit [Butyrivibrio sp.]
MELIGFLIFFPFIIALALAFVKNNVVRKAVTYISAVIVAGEAIAFAVNFLVSGKTVQYLYDTEVIDIIMLIGEIFMMIMIIVLSAKYKKLYVAALSVIQTAAIVWLEFSGYMKEYELHHIYADRLTVIMVLMIGVIGSMICIYAAGYMRDYHHHHKEFTDRRKFFFSMLFVFLGSMFGLVFSSNMIWIYFFWEITSVSSFLLIGYTRTEEAVNNSFRALWMNLLGGVGFAAAIIFSVIKLNIINLADLLTCESGTVIIPIMLLAFAGLTKSAQLPFSRWLMGAMVAPTPTSALLHSATMVKAGVYLLIRLAPGMRGTSAGMTVAIVGGFTFFVASIRAIIHSDGKKILAYSTVSNLGLITACAGVGTDETVWAGVFLMIFHSVSKSLLFQSVGAVENTIGSRDIEDMHGLIKRYPRLAIVITVGIAGMFLAPFGMLISKWAALKAFVDAHNAILVLLLAFGSATTMFYWTKWLLKILAWSEKTVKQKNMTSSGQWVSLIGHALIMVVLVLVYPLISRTFMQPMLNSLYGYKVNQVLQPTDMIIMAFMVIAIFVVPFVAYHISKHSKSITTTAYMSGINRDNGRKFIDSFGEEKTTYLANWYLIDIFGPNKFLKPATLIATAGLIIGMIITIGGAM